MATYNKFQQFVEDLAEKVHNCGADLLKVMLCLTAPVATNAIKANLTEIAAGNGYTAGGTAPSITSSVQTTGTYKLVLADVTFTAAGAPMANFRYPVLYNDTPTSPADPLIAWWDYGSTVTLLDTEVFTVDYDPSTGVIQLA